MGSFFTKCIVLVFGLLFIIPCSYKINAYVKHNNEALMAYGKVVKPGKGQYFGCRPYIAFYDAEGSKFEIKSEINYYIFFCPEIGDKIKILYTQNDPTKAMVASLLHYLIIPVIFVIIGIYCLYSVFTGKVK